ncbi:hypothetical protein LWI29_032665 [Acer saccharum]|uniref:Putative plant transposon protein domain-containing protein n=1 Tax=Acer saccharum TaxID=4024 RepID=A0AA39W7C5_ACESA|nr:hypothetical protein LWI29_032665 [Acer saccharum]
MGKTKQANPKEGTSRGTRTSQGLGPCVQNKDFVAKLRVLKDRTVIFERGIQLYSLSDTSIPRIVRNHKWDNFVQNPGVANLTIVREFLTSMIPRNFNSKGVVMVREVQVQVSEDTINNLFDTYPISQPQAPFGYTLYSENSEELARLLRGNEDGRWDNDHLIRQSDLPKDLALMNLFICASLRPVSHYSSLATKRAPMPYYEAMPTGECSGAYQIKKKIDDLALQQYDDRQEQEAEDENIRADVATVRTQLGYQTYQRRERCKRPPPPPPPSSQGFAAEDYVPDDMDHDEIVKRIHGQDPMP